MKRTKPAKPIRLPDIINNSISQDFSCIPNKIIRDPTLSCKAKTVLCILLSNKKGWQSCVTTLMGMMKEGRTAIQTAMKELEEHGYLIRIRFRCKDTKKIKGTLWVYTNEANSFDMTNTYEELEKVNMALMIPKNAKKPYTGKPYPGKPYPGKPYPGNQPLIILKEKRLKEKEQSLSEEISSDTEITSKNNKPSIQNRNNKYMPIARFLHKIISSHKNIKHSDTQIKAWANEIRKLSEMNDISLDRIKTVLRWYWNNIGGEYIPVVESGHSLRMKFTRLEDAMNRQTKFSKNGNHESNDKYDPFAWQRAKMELFE